MFDKYTIEDNPNNTIYNYDKLDLNTPEGKEEFLLRFLKSKHYPPIAIAILMSQAKVETDHFRTLKEYGNFAYFKKMRYGQRLGNRNDKEGALYRGRGYIQLTGRTNYINFSKFSGIDVVNNPEIAEQPHVAAEIFDWFINHGNHYRSGKHVIDCAMEGDIIGASKLVNGGTNGLKERIKYFEDYKRKLKLS